MNKKYQVFTPESTVSRMLDLSGYMGEVITKAKIVDFSCGDGAFLCVALKRFISESKKVGLQPETIRERTNSLFFGYEIHEDVYKKCIDNLNNIMVSSLGMISKWENIKCKDGLKSNISNFDFVFGNPPYISYKELAVSDRLYLKQNYKTCKGDRFDYSYAFIEKSIDCLAQNGRSCVIAPINMYKMRSAKYYRSFVVKYLISLFDVSDENIFYGVLTNPAISLFYKNKKSNSFIYESNNSYLVLDDHYLSDRLLFKRNKKRGLRFGDYFKVSCGVATLLNDVFLVDDNKNIFKKDGYIIEEDILKNAMSPRLEFYKQKKKIIFPYYFVDGFLCKYEEEELKSNFPNTYKYLKSHKDELLKRDSDVSAKWYEYGRSQAVAFQNQEKILIQSIVTNKLSIIEMTKDDIPIAGYYIIPLHPDVYNLDTAINVLNNKKMFDYLKSVGIKLNGNSFRYSCKDLEEYIF